MKMEQGLTIQGQTDLAQLDPATAWIYAPNNRIGIDNESRNGFVVKGTDEKISELSVIVRGIKPLHSHKQPDEKRKNDARHIAPVEWCESFDNRITNSQGEKCATCPAFSDCKWKFELTVNVADREGDYLLTIPTVSSLRFQNTVKTLAKNHRLHFTQAVFKMTVHVEKSNNNAYPVIDFAVYDMESGESLSGTAKTPAALQSATPPRIEKTKEDFVLIVQQRGLDKDAANAIAARHYRNKQFDWGSAIAEIESGNNQDLPEAIHF
jgi:hypothetical protein